MAKIILNPIVEQVSGGLGNLVFRELRGETILSRKPVSNGAEPTPGQAAHRERFKQAVAYGKFAMADNASREFYQYAAGQKNIPAFALSVADFLNLPSVEEVDLSAYEGQVNDSIKIITSDDFGVVNLHVAISNNQGGAIIESGQAIEYPVGTGRWNYTATAAVTPGTAVTIEVTATDRPGGTAVNTSAKTL